MRSTYLRTRRNLDNYGKTLGGLIPYTSPSVPKLGLAFKSFEIARHLVVNTHKGIRLFKEMWIAGIMLVGKCRYFSACTRGDRIRRHNSKMSAFSAS